MFRATKFVVPSPMNSHVARPRLEKLLDAAATVRLSVVSGRAGCGKSALVSAWMDTIDESDRAWITLDDDDNLTADFWRDIDAALAPLGADSHDRLFGQGAHTDAFLVLDQAHRLNAENGRRNVAELVAIAPGWLHLVLTSRERPDASLWPLRVAGELFEIGDDDLRLNVDEAIELLTAEPDFPSHEAVPAFELTEGWITGLKLMALARRSGDDDQSAIREFLFEEVVAPQAPEVQKFLMETSCLEELTPALCEHVTGRSDAADLLDQLERTNAFLSQVPGEYRVYRSHGQLRAMLCDELKSRDPVRANTIHVTTARWYEQQHDAARAVEQWLAAGNVGEAVRLLPRAYFGAPYAQRDDLVRSWCARIPASVVPNDPDTLLDYATALAAAQDVPAWRETLDRVDAMLKVAPDDAAMVRAAFLRGLLHCMAADVEGLVAALERAERLTSAYPTLLNDERLDPGPPLSRLDVWLVLGYTWLGRPADANRMLTRMSPGPGDAVDGHFRDSARALAELASGHLEGAGESARRALEKATSLGVIAHFSARGAHYVRAALLHEHDELPRAREEFETLIEQPVGPPTGMFSVTAQLALADVMRSQGHILESLEVLMRVRREGEHRAGTTVDNWLTRSAILGLLALGRNDAARITLGSPPYSSGLAVAAALVELAHDRPLAASRHLAAMRVDTPRVLLCASLVSARIADDRLDQFGVERHLRRSLRIARAQGFVRTVVDLAPGLLPRFVGVCTSPDDADHVARLHRAVGHTLGVVDRHGADGSAGMQLSGRELDVLRYLPTQLTAREIAHALHVSLNTVKTHTHNLYRKLGCDSREGAIEQARLLHLLR